MAARAKVCKQCLHELFVAAIETFYSYVKAPMKETCLHELFVASIEAYHVMARIKET
jgi:hypothetical protein